MTVDKFTVLIDKLIGICNVLITIKCIYIPVSITYYNYSRIPECVYLLPVLTRIPLAVGDTRYITMMGPLSIENIVFLYKKDT